MKTRIVSALVGIVVLLAVLFCPILLVLVLAASALAVMAVWELLHNTGLLKNKIAVIGSMVFSALFVLVCSSAQAVATAANPWSPMPADALLPLAWGLLAVYVVFMLMILVAYRKQLSFITVGKAFLLTLYAAVGFSAMSALRIDSGLVGLFLLLIIPWMSDTGAYFTGMLIGKHKMAPVISPKKTWEGFFGGWIVSIGSSALLAVIANWIYTSQDMHFDVAKFAVIAMVLAPLSVCGDLFASLIKRRCGIKDYGRIMPGHGGVMDRFDSVVMIAPLLYLVCILFG